MPAAAPIAFTLAAFLAALSLDARAARAGGHYPRERDPFSVLRPGNRIEDGGTIRDHFGRRQGALERSPFGGFRRRW